MMLNPKFSVDTYLDKTFSLHDYNCWHFAADVWADLTGVRLHAFLDDFSAQALNEVAEYKAEGLQRLLTPTSPCLVLMQRRKVTPHVGVYVKDRVLQLKRGGASYMSLALASMGFTTISYYQ